MRSQDRGWNPLQHSQAWKMLHGRQAEVDALCARYNGSMASDMLQKNIGPFLLEMPKVNHTLDAILYDATHKHGGVTPLPERIDALADRLEQTVLPRLELMTQAANNEKLRNLEESNFVCDCFDMTSNHIATLRDLSAAARAGKYQHLIADTKKHIAER